MDVVQRSVVEVSHRTDGAMAIRMAGRKQAFEHAIFDQAVRLVITLTLFVLYDAALIVEFLFGNDAQQMAHSI